jgi:hypothetical protein
MDRSIVLLVLAALLHATNEQSLVPILPAQLPPFGAASQSTRVNSEWSEGFWSVHTRAVVPECSNQYMIVHMKFDPSRTAAFSDWLIVGTNNHPACAHQGRGELEYVIEIPLINDPCGTRMVTLR